MAFIKAMKVLGIGSWKKAPSKNDTREHIGRFYLHVETCGEHEMRRAIIFNASFEQHTKRAHEIDYSSAICTGIEKINALVAQKKLKGFVSYPFLELALLFKIDEAQPDDSSYRPDPMALVEHINKKHLDLSGGSLMRILTNPDIEFLDN